MTKIFANHVGFLPDAPKTCVITDPEATTFEIVRRLPEREVVHSAPLKQVVGDFGEAWVGDFSEVREEGMYLIRCGQTESRAVTIYQKIYDYPLRMLVNFFASQRCGDSTTGWNAPCHVNDARDVATGEHVDVSGGWHQSSDLRKWTVGTSFGLIGLAKLLEKDNLRWDTGQLDEEIRWGNAFFHKMVRDDGGLMDHVVVPLGWDDMRDLYSNDAPYQAAFSTMIGQALIAQRYHDQDPAYAQSCLKLAERMWDYLHESEMGAQPYQPPFVPRYHEWMPAYYNKNYRGTALFAGDALYTALEMYRATGDEKWLDAACEKADELVSFQIGGDVVSDPMAACFRLTKDAPDIATMHTNGFFGLMGLCELLDLKGDAPAAERWYTALKLVVDQKIMMADRNAWGIIPNYWHHENTGNFRPVGSGYYRYFFNHDTLKIGINVDILASAIFLLKAETITGNPRCATIAYRQLDWVLGCNPLDSSSVEGVGYNQRERLINIDEFFPPVPQIPGAVMTGYIGTDHDEPVPELISHGPEIPTEYDIPPTALLMWFWCHVTP